jgi:hypothetical protein
MYMLQVHMRRIRTLTLIITVLIIKNLIILCITVSTIASTRDRVVYIILTIVAIVIDIMIMRPICACMHVCVSVHACACASSNATGAGVPRAIFPQNRRRGRAGGQCFPQATTTSSLYASSFFLFRSLYMHQIIQMNIVCVLHLFFSKNENKSYLK